MSNTIKEWYDYHAKAQTDLHMRFPESLQANLGLGLVTITPEAASGTPYNTIMRALHAYARGETVVGLQLTTRTIGEYKVTEVSL